MRNRTDWVYERLGVRFRDAALVEAALTHRSAAARNNERLEFLGDAVLSFVVAELLYREFPHCDEGELSRYRARLVSGEALADAATALGLGEQLTLGSGELKSGGFRRRSILADALEALFGAIYLDAGIESARTVIQNLLEPRLAGLADAGAMKDPKTQLQEWLQARGLPLPAYQVAAIMGEPHLQTFQVRCVLQEPAVETLGAGSSRRQAEQQAAQAALAGLQPARTPA
jgi:ribonuclease III